MPDTFLQQGEVSVSDTKLLRQDNTETLSHTKGQIKEPFTKLAQEKRGSGLFPVSVLDAITTAAARHGHIPDLGCTGSQRYPRPHHCRAGEFVPQPRVCCLCLRHQLAQYLVSAPCLPHFLPLSYQAFLELFVKSKSERGG